MRRLVALVILAVATSAGAQNARLELRPGETLLEVQATGVDRRRPDVMEMRAGVVTTGRTVAEAAAENSRLANQLVDAVYAQGIAPQDVQTSQLRIMPRFDESDRERADEEGREPRIVGYVATNELSLRLRDLGRSSDLLDALVAAGANSVEGPEFSLSDEAPAIAVARQAAARDARAEAEAYARAFGMRVERVLRISERSASVGGQGGIIITGSRIQRPPIEPGDVDTHVTIWVDFALAPQ